MPIPDYQPRSPLIPPAAPTPIPAKLAPPPATMPISPPPFPVALPPVEYDHRIRGQADVITKKDDYDLIRLICKDTPNAIACSYRTYDSVSGKPISCLIMLGPGTWEDERVMQHEVGHCNGWSNNHERARYGD